MTILLRIVPLLLLVGVASAQAQSITIGEVTHLQNCVNDDLVVPYKATGSFASDNQFFVQLSDANGSFSPWTNSTQRSARDSDLLLMHLGSTGDHFRVRIASSDPFVTSSDNGSDIVVVSFPAPNPQILGRRPKSSYRGFTGEALQFSDNEPTDSRVAWHFEPDAVPDTSTELQPSVVFTTPGQKTAVISVTNKFGCSSVQSIAFNILTCTPTIPAGARIVTDNASGGDTVVWVKAGGSYTANAQFETQRLFVDPGGQATAGFRSMCLAYVRNGGSLINNADQGELTAVLSPGVTINCGYNCDTFYCPSLAFELGVEEPASVPIAISQFDDHFYAHSDGEPLTLHLFDLLGNAVLTASANSELVCDLRELPSGFYFADVRSATQRLFRKILR